MVGMLSGIPKTPLHARLKEEGRLDLDDEQPFGTNVIPLGMTRDELRDGYDPDFYFERLENLFLTRQFDWARTSNAYWRRHPWRKLKSQSVDAVPAAGLIRPGVTPDLSPSDDYHAPSTARSGPVVHLCDQVRDALPPLHDVPPDGFCVARFSSLISPSVAGWRTSCFCDLNAYVISEPR